MTITEIATLANNYTDENFADNIVLGYANIAISKINIAVRSKLPLFSSTSEDYITLGVDWIHSIVVPYVCWSIKMNDSSLNEANAYLFQFQQGIQDLIKNKNTAIPKENQGGGFSSVHVIKPYKGMR